MDEFTELYDIVGEDLFAVPEKGWRLSDDGAILMLYGHEDWPYWRWRTLLSQPYTFPEIQKRAFELKKISRWVYYWLVMLYKFFGWLPADWDTPEDLLDEEE